MTLADRVAVMRAGIIEQVAPPLEVYARPVNTFVAGFIGSPPMNMLPAAVAGVSAGPQAVVGIRPHDVEIGTEGSLRATVDLVEPRGHDAVVHLTLRGEGPRELVAVVNAGEAPPAGAEVFVRFREGAVHLFDREDGGRLNR